MIASLIRKSLAGFHAEQILDVGPGYADFSRISARLTGGRHITFIDSDRNVLQFQEVACRRAGFTVTSILFDMEQPATIPTDSFQLIHCQEVLEHLDRPEVLLGQLSAGLRSGGRIIVTVPSGSSERWLKFLNPDYMRNEPHGHVQEFSMEDLSSLAERCGLRVVTLCPAQPHYFLAHTWMALSRMKVEGSTGRIVTGGIRGRIFHLILACSGWIFRTTAPQIWSRIFPRNYFLVGERPR